MQWHESELRATMKEKEREKVTAKSLHGAVNHSRQLQVGTSALQAALKKNS